MEATITFLEKQTASTGTEFYKVQFQEFPDKTGGILFTNDHSLIKVGEKITVAEKQNPNGQFVWTHKKPFKNFSSANASDPKMECLKLSVGLINADKVQLKDLETVARRLKEVYDKL